MGRHRRGRNSLSKVKRAKDRLSPLPDVILINILSRLPIDYAVATSVLSRRWHHLWTGVTCFKFCPAYYFETEKYERLSAVTLNILVQLTSLKLSVFDVHVGLLTSLCTPDMIESCFHELRYRKVEKIFIKSTSCGSSYDFIIAPTCLFQTQSLVTLHFSCLVQFPNNAVAVHFPNLKVLHLQTLFTLPLWLGTLFSSCPLLEDLSLRFDLFNDDYPEPYSDLKIFAHNLKSLHIEVTPSSYPHAKFFIDAPRLTTLEIVDCTSCYYFIQKPTRLVKA